MDGHKFGKFQRQIVSVQSYKHRGGKVVNDQCPLSQEERLMYMGQDGPRLTSTDTELSPFQHHFSPFAHRFSPSWDHFNTGSKFRDRSLCTFTVNYKPLNYFVLYLHCSRTCQVVPRQTKTVRERTVTVLKQ